MLDSQNPFPRGDAPRPVILIVEGNSEEIVLATRAIGRMPTGESFAAALERLAPGVEFRIVRPYFSGFDAAQVDFEDVVGVALTGSCVAWSADAPETKPHRAIIERIFHAGLPVYGSCFGLHVPIIVLGGAVRWSPNGHEIGLARAVRLTSEGARHAMFEDKPAQFESCCIHRDEVSRLPDGATLLATNEHSEVQAVAYETGGVRYWGAQYHPELTLADIADMLDLPGHEVFTDPTKFETAEDLARTIADFRRIAHEAPAALLWRYGVSIDAVEPWRRMRELQNWLATLTIAAPGMLPAQAQQVVAPRAAPELL